jgi:lipopolysaccharide/colanic/teichoic acid biosynthesis glycosyltransferase
MTKAALKRAFDLFTSALMLIALAPFLLVLALVVRLTSPGPVFYASPRLGLRGRPFRMIKFRTMVAEAERRGPLVTAGDDPRITPIGRFLRRTKLDELPSLWNVLRGDMSIVGPRPENPQSAALYTEEQKRVLTVRPGITSLATIAYRHEEEMLAGAQDLDAAYFLVMQDKLALELEYLDRQSFWLDLRIIFQTILAVLQ